MKISTLRLKDETGEKVFQSFNLIKNHGVENDVKAKGGERQLCLCDEDSLLQYRTDKKGLCVKRFMPNITTTGLDYSNLKEGDKFKISGAEIEISSTLKKCFDECPLYKNGNECQIKHACAFAKITKSGTITMGDEILES